MLIQTRQKIGMMKQKKRQLENKQQTSMRYIITEIKYTRRNQQIVIQRWTSNLEDRVVEIVKTNRKKGKKKVKIKEENLQDSQLQHQTH